MSDENALARVERIDAIRGNLSGIVRELDRRRHALTDWRGQLAEHKPKVVAAGISLVALVGLVGVAALLRGRRNARVGVRARKLGRALARVAADPDRLAASSPSLFQRLAKVVVGATFGTTVYVVVTRLIDGAQRRIEHNRQKPKKEEQPKLLSIDEGYRALNPPGSR